jgi:hypothetical protein
VIDSDKEGLRVSRYFGDHPHSRFSVWSAGRADAAVSLDMEETQRLGQFLARSVGVRTDQGLSSLRQTVRALRDAITKWSLAGIQRSNLPGFGP